MQNVFGATASPQSQVLNKLISNYQTVGDLAPKVFHFQIAHQALSRGGRGGGNGIRTIEQ
jgi:hypothetical protein